MNMTTGSVPVRHFVCDGFAEPRADWTVPPADAPGAWDVEYDNDAEKGKRAARSLSGWSAGVLRQMNDLDTLRTAAQFFGIAAYPDSLNYGGGLQVIASGGWLNAHLDAALHAQRPHLRRAIQMVCFCNYDWRPEWGGEFCFFSPNGNVLEKFLPLPGRLIAFEAANPRAFHGVLPVTGPAERISVATSLLADARECDVFTRAVFLPTRVKYSERESV